MRRRRRNRQPRTIQDFVRAGVLRPVQPTTASGWTRYGTGREFLPALTNLVPDPQGVLADGTFWPADTAHTNTTANVTAPLALPADLGGLTKCVSYVNDGTADAPVTANLTVTASLAYNTSLYVYAPTVGGTITITAENGHSFTVATIAAANAGWTRYSIYSPTVAAEVTLNIKVSFAGGGASTIYITGAQVTQTAYAAPFFCGASTTAGGSVAWSGTANASTSTLTQSRLAYSAAFLGTVLTELTIAARYTAGWNSTDGFGPQTTPFVAGIGTTDTASVAQFKWNGAAALRIEATTTSTTGALTIAQDAVHCAVARLSAAAIKLNHDGTNATAGAAPTLGGAIAQVVIGDRNNTHQAVRFVGSIGPVIISPSAKADAWVAEIQADSGAAYTSIPRLVRDFMVAGDFIAPLIDNSTAYIRVA